MKKLLFLILFNATIFAQFSNVQVNKPISKTPEEVTIAINPVNPNVIAAGANINYSYSSVDGGKSWAEKKLTSSLGVWGDPCVVFDALGNLYYAHLSNPLQGYWIDRIVVQKSSDNGKTWNDGAGVGLTFPRNQDKEWLAVDVTNSIYRNNVYMSWTEFDNYGSFDKSDSSRILFSKSTNGGINWTAPIVISDKGGNCVDSDSTAEGAVPAVGPDGEIFISWANAEGIFFDRSFDGGETFGRDKIVSDIPGGWDFDVPGIMRCNGLPITACDLSKSKYRGNVYVLWGDQRNGTTDSDVYFVKSTDKGETWSQRIKVNDDNTNRHQFFPWMTVDSTSGIIYVIFYDRRNTAGAETEVFLARSDDGGETFKNFKISESSFIPNSSVFFGDYTGIAAYRGEIRPIWMRMDKTSSSSYELSVLTALIKDSDLITSVDQKEKDILHGFYLYDNYPNPFNPSTTIGFQIEQSSFVSLKIYDSLGREVEQLLHQELNPGIHEVKFDAKLLSSGVYYYNLNNGENFVTKKMLLLK